MKILLRWIGWSLVAYPVTLVPVMTGLFAYYWMHREPGWGSRKETFPLVVLVRRTPDAKREPVVTTMGELPRVVSNLADYSFSIPREELTAVLKRIDSMRSGETEQHQPGRFEALSLEVRDASGGAQQIHLVASVYQDHWNESWYLARGRSITPRFHRERTDIGVGGTTVFVGPVATLPVALLIGAVIAFLRRGLTRKKGDDSQRTA